MDLPFASSREIERGEQRDRERRILTVEIFPPNLFSKKLLSALPATGYRSFWKLAKRGGENTIIDPEDSLFP